MKFLKKVSHNNGLIPTYETNKKQTDQTKDRTEKNKQKTKPMLKSVVGKSLMLGPM